MARSPIYYLSLLAILTASVSSCHKTTLYKKEIAAAEKPALARQLLQGAEQYYQGSTANMMVLKEGIMMDSTVPELWRELATPYLKRGLPHQAFTYYDREVDLAPELWQGWRGYLYLYFYHDYKRAIADFNATDTLTEITDYPQGQSVDYMRGLCYYGLNDYETALKWFTKYIDEVTKTKGEDWVDVYGFLYRGLTYDKLGMRESAVVDFNTGLKYDPRLSDFYYHKARVSLEHSLAPKGEIAEWAKLAVNYFKAGYFHHRDYVEVHDQIYIEDVEAIETRLANAH